MIDRARSASTTDSEVPRSANVAMSVLLELTSSGRSSDPGSAVHVEETGSLGRPWGLPDFSTVAHFPAWDCDLRLPRDSLTLEDDGPVQGALRSTRSSISLKSAPFRVSSGT